MPPADLPRPSSRDDFHPAPDHSERAKRRGNRTAQGNNRTRPIAIRLTDSERDLVDQAAARYGYDVRADFIRSCLAAVVDDDGFRPPQKVVTSVLTAPDTGALTADLTKMAGLFKSLLVTTPDRRDADELRHALAAHMKLLRSWKRALGVLAIHLKEAHEDELIMQDQEWQE